MTPTAISSGLRAIRVDLAEMDFAAAKGAWRANGWREVRYADNVWTFAHDDHPGVWVDWKMGRMPRAFDHAAWLKSEHLLPGATVHLRDRPGPPSMPLNPY